MIVAMQERASEEQIQAVIERLVELGFEVHRSTGKLQTVLGAVGARVDFDIRDVEVMDGVKEVHRISSPYKLVARSFRPEGTTVKLRNGVSIGGERRGGDGRPVLGGVARATVHHRRGRRQGRCAGVARRRLQAALVSPYSFQGLGEEGLKLLKEAGDKFGLLVITEVMEISQIPLMEPYVDIYQVGARNMQNFNLLRELGKVRKPVMLKRGIAATIEEMLLSAEYIMAGGNYEVMLCERGIRTFETYTRNTLDISAIPIVHKLSHLPITADPSHGTGRRDKVSPMARAAVAAGADAVIVEVHHQPDKALSDGAQSLYPEQFAKLMDELRMIAPAVGRKIA